MTSEENGGQGYRHALSASKRIIDRVQCGNMPEATKNLLLNIVQWIELKSRSIVNDTITDLINRQLCSLLDILDLFLPKTIANSASDSPSPPATDNLRSDATATPHNSTKRYKKSLLLHASAKGDLPEAVQAASPPEPGDQAIPEAAAEPTRERTHFDADDRPDILLDIPDLTIDNLELEVSDLHVLLKFDTEVAYGLVKICPCVEVNLGSASVKLNNLQANALCVVRMDNLRQIVDNTLRTVERNPDAVAALRNVDTNAKKCDSTDPSTNTYNG